jgi:hypothetical protein
MNFGSQQIAIQVIGSTDNEIILEGEEYYPQLPTKEEQAAIMPLAKVKVQQQEVKP